MFRKHWVRRLTTTSIVLAIVLIGGWFYVRNKSEQRGLRELTAVTTRLDADDPRWRFDDIDADRGTLPDDQNSALLIPKFKAALGGRDVNAIRPDKSQVFEKVPPNHRLDDEGALAIDRALEGQNAALAIARSFKDYPRGLRRYHITPDVIGTLMPDVQEHRAAVQLLKLEAERLSSDGRPGAALQLTPAMLNVARGLDGEPFLISALVRIACDAVTVHRVERTLALGVPRGGLAEVQAALLAEAEGDVFWGPLRGERALMDRLFTNLHAGAVPPSAVLAIAGAGPQSGRVESLLTDYAYRPFLAQDHAACLEAMNQMYAIRTQPESQQRAAFQAIPIPPAGLGTQITHLLLPATNKIHDASLRHKAMMRSAGVAIACERFRQARGRWPEALAELPKDLLAAIPSDPFDGLPLKFARRPDGVTVYSVGFDGTDDGGNVTDKAFKDAGVDLGFRLFDPDQRGLPAVAPLDPEGILGSRDLRYRNQKAPVEIAPRPRDTAAPDR